jgi:tetratricopeptide (TPR) repeat protein
VTAQLVEAATELNIWAESYEREFTGILALQSDVARAVAGTIRVKLGPQDHTPLTTARAVSPATYEAYLKGMFYLNKGTPEETKKGLAYLHEAVEQDPADPMAYAGLALGYVELAHAAEAREDSLLRAKAAATTALKLDGTLAEALAARAMVEGYHEWNWSEAFRNFDRSLEVNPSLSIAYFHRAWFHVLFGRMARAEKDQKRARELDPFNPAITSHLGMLYSYERRHEEALAEALRSVEMAPTFPLGYAFLARIYRHKGMYDEAVAAARKAGELSPAWRGIVGLIYALVGQMEEARELLAELDQQKLTPMNAFWKIQICIALGEMDEAFRWMDYEPRHVWVPWITVMPGLERLRSDPRFPELLLRMHLPR